MSARRAIVAVVLAAAGVAIWLLIARYLRTVTVAVLDPRGPVAQQQRQLILLAVGMSLLIVVPVFVLLILFAVRYRDRGDASRYSPELRNNTWIETAWWAGPCLLIGILAVVAWTSAHDLDPYRPLPSQSEPLNVQVVALQWKWLFMYPDQHIATVNSLVIPVDRPVHFVLTSDGPMNSFWIPQLGSQVYAMPGMQTQLNLGASEPGTYTGQSANLSGSGFAGMRFDARAASAMDFQQFVDQSQRSTQSLDQRAYADLRRPTQDVAPSYFRLVDSSLFGWVCQQHPTPSASVTP